MGSFVFTRWFALIAISLVAVAGFFWRDVAEQSSDGVHGVFFEADRPAEVGTDDVARYLARALSAQSKLAGQFEVSEVRLESRSAGQVLASAQLKRTNARGPYPHLIVELSAKDGSKGRQVILSPADYEHGAGLSDERVRFKFEPRPGDDHLDVRAGLPTASTPADHR